VKESTRLKEVSFESTEVAAVCPVTGQPDQYTVTIKLKVASSSIESKSLKLYLQQFRNEGIFCEALADTICKDIVECCSPLRCLVSVEQKSRGGITLTSLAEYSR
jgi:7-cyano-7-deazaguanine reductase